jgi:NhaA family Na+:H+ antiporter
VERLELTLHPWVAFGVMPVFALANAGMAFTLEVADPGMVIAIVAGFVLGKPVGILCFSWLALRLGFADRPAELTWGRLTGGAMLAGTGFTMALFVAQLAFADSQLESAKLGILLSSCLAAVLGVSILAIAARAAPGSR